jgi:hypothetical protein
MSIAVERQQELWPLMGPAFASNLLQQGRGSGDMLEILSLLGIMLQLAERLTVKYSGFYLK